MYYYNMTHGPRASSSFFSHNSSRSNGASTSERSSSALEAEFARSFVTCDGRRLKADKIRHSTSAGCPKGASAVSRAAPIQKGVLWLQKEGMFSRWKERYFILTRDYLHCFKKSSGSSYGKISEMGQFLFKMKLTDIERLERTRGRTTPTITLHLHKREKIALRCGHGPDALENWFSSLQNCKRVSEERLDYLKVSQSHFKLRKTHQECFNRETTLNDCQMHTEPDYYAQFQREAVIRRSFNPTCEVLRENSVLRRSGRISLNNHLPYTRSSLTSTKTYQISPYNSVNSTSTSCTSFPSPYASINSQIGLNYKRSSLRRQFPLADVTENRKSHDYTENACYRSSSRRPRGVFV